MVVFELAQQAVFSLEVLLVQALHWCRASPAERKLAFVRQGRADSIRSVSDDKSLREFLMFFSLNILAHPITKTLNSSIAYEKGKLEDHSSDTYQHPDGPGHHARRDKLHELKTSPDRCPAQ